MSSNKVITEFGDISVSSISKESKQLYEGSFSGTPVV